MATAAGPRVFYASEAPSPPAQIPPEIMTEDEDDESVGEKGEDGFKWT